MFNLIRRISGSVVPRQDRPWAEDATSNAPAKRKRRASWDDQERSDRNKSLSKRPRGPDVVAEAETANASETADETTPVVPVTIAEAVKEVTQGVDEVRLEGEPEADISTPAPEPHRVPLPAEEDKDELNAPPSPENLVEEANVNIPTNVDPPLEQPAPAVTEGQEANEENEPEKPGDAAKAVATNDSNDKPESVPVPEEAKIVI